MNGLKEKTIADNQVEILDTIKEINIVNEIDNIEQNNSTKDKIIYKILKRSFDIVSSAIGLLILWPIFLIIAAAIKINSKGPVFFVHKRFGKDGKNIKMYKFRSMYNNAEDMIKDFTPKQMEEWKENYKLENDPRVTKVGNFLRKTSLDELPQLFNILKGDLSVIGPRPVIGEELEKYGANKEKFLSVQPGLTGYWAANGRSDTTYDERMEMELYYIDNMCLSLDIKIFFKTIFTVLKREGAK